MSDFGFIALDTTAPEGTLDLVTAVAGEVCQVNYALSEPDMVSAQLILTDGRILGMTVQPDSGDSGVLYCDLPRNSTATASVLASVGDALGNTDDILFGVRIHLVESRISIRASGAQARAGSSLVRL